ncbi:MAG: YihY family inner membrane protein [Deltaproteobacteria bacterium]|nr:YihY family inner membrane protein [Deltaproteobacteria bacterium]
MGGRLPQIARLAWDGARNVLRALSAEDLRLRALALTTITLFAVVPALVVAFSFLQAFAGMDAMWQRARDFLLANLAVGARASVEPYLERTIANAHATSAGLVGAALLVGSAVSLLGYVERALNELWAVRKKRPLVQKILIYWAALTLGPLLLAGSLTLAHQVEGQVGKAVARLLGRGASVALTCAFFAVLYAIVPATKVRLKAAVAGGVVAGISWELAKGLYTWVVSRFFQYDAIYGSVAAVPIFLLWLYISWTLLLFGARVAFVVQHARQLVRGREPEETPLGRELLGARALLEVARAFRRGAPPPEPGEVATALLSPAEPVREVLSRMRAAGLLHEAGSGGLVPARPLDQLSLADVRRALSGGGPGAGPGPAEALVTAVLLDAEGAAARALASVSYEELCRRLDGAGSPAP